MAAWQRSGNAALRRARGDAAGRIAADTGHGGYAGRMSRNKPQRYRPERAPRAEIAIDDLDDAGRGVGRMGGKVVFVAGALPGESVRARYTATARRADEAVTEAVLEPSPDRVSPFCPVFDRCGGCSLQHYRVAAQRHHRERRLYHQLTRATGTAPSEWLAPLTGRDRGYRGRARWRCQWDARSGVTLGFREQGGHRVVDADACPVLDERLSDLMPELESCLGTLDGASQVRAIEACTSDADTALGVVSTRALAAPDRERLAAFQRRTGVVVVARAANEAGFAPVEPGRAPELRYDLGQEGVSLAFGLGDFVQANRGVNQALVARAMAWLAPASGARIVDLFCGMGNFALPAARRGAAVLGVDGDEDLIARAQGNAATNGLAGRATFEQADLAGDGLGARLAAWLPDAVVLDPPRGGAAAAVEALQSYPPPRIVYIGCEPATVARDVARLVAAPGYALRAAGMADMFPHTDHTEVFVCLDR
jgi:23S rRNA (uracil1939-C5)-methyltransferase